jgi:hypothetical protein
LENEKADIKKTPSKNLWFYQTLLKEQLYVAPREKGTFQVKTKHMSHIPKVMLLAANARPWQQQ